MPSKKRPAKPGKKLLPMQRAFIEALAKDPRQNLTAAAKAAGYSPKAASKTASDLMNLPQYQHVQIAYQKLVDERFAQFTDKKDEDIFRILTAQAFGDRRGIQKIVDGKLVVVDSDELFPEQEWLIDHYRQRSLNDGTGDTFLEPVLVNRLDAVKSLAKIRGLMREKVDVEATITITEARESLKSKLAGFAALGYSGQVPGVANTEGTPGA